MPTTPMHQAISLGEGVRSQTAPNPWVGCVVVAAGSVIGEGATEPPGGRHAEVVALAQAGARAAGATVYVTLEPCAHHGRTAPCVEALIAAGVARVVIGVEDPDPQVAGRGIAALRSAGIDVSVGDSAEAISASLAPYLHQRRTGRPFVLWKTAMSLDGKIAPVPGTQAWITGPAARLDAHRLRAASQAILVGRGTAVADAPRLTVRDVPVAVPPYRVLLDSSGSTPATGPLFDDTAPTLVYTASTTPGEAWRAAGAEVIGCKTTPQGVDLFDVLDDLGRRGVLQLMVEGGARVAGAFLDANLVDEIVAYVAPVVLGDEALAAVVGAVGSTIPFAGWHFVETAIIGPDVRLTLRKQP